MMEKNTFFKLIIVLLLLLNLGTLGYLFFMSSKTPAAPPRGPMPPFAEMMQRQLQLNDRQTQQIREQHERHLQTMDSLTSLYQQTLEQYFSLLQQETITPGQKTALEKNLSDINAQRTSETFRHFYAIAQLLTPEQLIQYKRRLPQILEPILHQRRNLPPPPGD